MKNPRTGEVVHVRTGFDLILFLTSWFFGLSLFIRKLNVWGAFMFGLVVVGELEMRSSANPTEELDTMIGWAIVYVALSLFFGIKGNELTAKNYLDLGWQFANPDAEETKAAKLAWGIKV